MGDDVMLHDGGIMSKTVEFVGRVQSVRTVVGETRQDAIRLHVEERGKNCDAFLNALDRNLYKVTLEPVEPEMKPCPFCGSDMVGLTHMCLLNVTCFNCKATGPRALTKEKAIELWNGEST